MFLLVPAYPGCPGSKAVKRSLFVVVVVVACLVVVRRLAVERRHTTSCQFKNGERSV